MSTAPTHKNAVINLAVNINEINPDTTSMTYIPNEKQSLNLRATRC
jgi:hypothetical protein